MSDINYDPACRDCRRDAGKDNAGTTWQCASHVCAERDALSTALTYEREVADVLMTRVHERDAEIALLKRELTQERKHTNDYIKALHRAERERDEARALLAEVSRERSRLLTLLIRAGVWKTAPCQICGYNGPGYYLSGAHDCARLDAALGDTP